MSRTLPNSLRRLGRRSLASLALLLTVPGLAALGLLAAGCSEPPTTTQHQVIVLGFDGMDYGITKRLMEEGRLPNLSRLAEQGTFGPLETAVPPQSPVAWSDFITGMDSGGHGIFDFVHRHADTLQPYLSTSETVPEHQDPGSPPPGTVVDLDIEQLILEGGGFYRLSGDETGLDLLFGLRWIGMDEVIDLTPPIPIAPGQRQESSSNLTDGFLGLRYIGQIGNKWNYSIRGDVATGGTELTLNGQAFFKYQLGQSGRYGLLLGYRYMGMEIEEMVEGVELETDLVYSGPVFGFMFKW